MCHFSVYNNYFGKCLSASAKSTGQSRLLVWYSGDEYLVSSFSHLFCGTELLIHFSERAFGSGITLKKIEKFIQAQPYFNSNKPASNI